MASAAAPPRAPTTVFEITKCVLWQHGHECASLCCFWFEDIHVTALTPALD
jgi:hypothetical protein